MIVSIAMEREEERSFDKGGVYAFVCVLSFDNGSRVVGGMEAREWEGFVAVAVFWCLGRQNRGQGNNARGAGAVGYGGAQNRVGNANPGQARQVKCYNSNEEILLKMNLPDHRIKLWWKWRYLVPVESIHSPMLTLNVFNQRHHDNQKTYNTASATLISNVMIKKSVSMPVRKSQRHMKVAFWLSNIAFCQIALHFGHCDLGYRKHDEIEHDNIIVDGLSKEVFYVASNSKLNVSRFTKMQKAHNVVKARCLELEAELSNLRNNIRKDNYNELLNRFSNLEVNHLNLQLKYQNLKDSFQNNLSSSVNDTPDFNSIFMISQMKTSLQGKDNVNGLQEQNELFRAENAKIKQHYKELYDSIKITLAKHTEQITALKNENESLKVQIQNTVSCVTTNQVKLNVLAPGKYVIDVKPIPPRNRNNREVHLHYLRHLKESVDTLREIVEEAKVERPLDRSLASACRYTKHSQELLEYVFGT
ncbi:hypothetical protein Tco_0714771 [Tanacetum coccineum]